MTPLQKLAEKKLLRKVSSKLEERIEKHHDALAILDTYLRDSTDIESSQKIIDDMKDTAIRINELGGLLSMLKKVKL